MLLCRFFCSRAPAAHGPVPEIHPLGPGPLAPARHQHPAPASVPEELPAVSVSQGTQGPAGPSPTLTRCISKEAFPRTYTAADSAWYQRRRSSPGKAPTCLEATEAWSPEPAPGPGAACPPTGTAADSTEQSPFPHSRVRIRRWAVRLSPGRALSQVGLGDGKGASPTPCQGSRVVLAGQGGGSPAALAADW